MAFDVSKLKPDNAKAIAIVLVVVVVLVFGLYYVQKTLGGFGKVFSSITDGLGITTSAAQAAVDQATQQAASPSSPWSPAFYQSAPSGASLLTQAAADALAKQIWGNWFWNDSDNALGAIKQCSTQSQVSFLADRFQQNYGKDLLAWITTQYTHIIGSPDPNLNAMITYVSNLPQYN